MKVIAIKEKISRTQLLQMAKKMFGSFVKAVVDIEQKIVAVDAELHADEEAALLESGSKQAHLWGINIYPEEKGEKFIEFDSMINIRPSQGNRSRSVEDPQIRRRIFEIVSELII